MVVTLKLVKRAAMVKVPPVFEVLLTNTPSEVLSLAKMLTHPLKDEPSALV